MNKPRFRRDERGRPRPFYMVYKLWIPEGTPWPFIDATTGKPQVRPLADASVIVGVTTGARRRIERYTYPARARVSEWRRMSVDEATERQIAADLTERIRTARKEARAAAKAGDAAAAMKHAEAATKAKKELRRVNQEGATVRRRWRLLGTPYGLVGMRGAIICLTTDKAKAYAVERRHKALAKERGEMALNDGYTEYLQGLRERERDAGGKGLRHSGADPSKLWDRVPAGPLDLMGLLSDPRKLARIQRNSIVTQALDALEDGETMTRAALQRTTGLTRMQIRDAAEDIKQGLAKTRATLTDGVFTGANNEGTQGAAFAYAEMQRRLNPEGVDNSAIFAELGGALPEHIKLIQSVTVTVRLEPRSDTEGDTEGELEGDDW